LFFYVVKLRMEWRFLGWLLLLLLFYGHYTRTTCVSREQQLRTGGFCWSKVQLPCWRQLGLLYRIRIREKTPLLIGVTCTVSVPVSRLTVHQKHLSVVFLLLQVAPTCIPSNTCFPGLIRVHIPNGISIGSFCTAHGTILYNRPHLPLKIVPLPGDLDHDLMHGSLDSPESRNHKASWLVQPFLQGSRSWQTDHASDANVCKNRPLLRT